jgi:cullin-4
MEPLNLLYRLLAKVGELAPLRTAFGKFIVAKGGGIVQEKEKDDSMIERLLEYKAVIDKTVEVAFLKDANFRQTQKESFEIFVNKRENKPAELIAKFLDARLRSGNKTMSDQELEHVLNEALILFRYTHGELRKGCRLPGATTDILLLPFLLPHLSSLSQGHVRRVLQATLCQAATAQPIRLF